MKPAVCLVCGPSGSGKTTLLERLVGELTARGRRVATVKHHRGRVEVDRPGKDTWRHRRAGAVATFFVTADEIVVFRDRPADVSPAVLAGWCPAGTELLLVEGFKGLTGYPRIEVVRRGFEREIPWTENVLCVATDLADFAAPCPVYGLEDAAGLADLLERELLPPGTSG